MTSVRAIPTPYGEARLHVDRGRRPRAALALGHGAGRGVDSPDLEALAKDLPRSGITVFRIEQPWRVAGRRVAGNPQTLDAATIACVNAIRVRCPLILGGRSAGARVACRLGRQLGAVGCVALAFPLHGSGSAPSRLDELLHARLPTLVVQGEHDRLGRPSEFPAELDVAVIPDADHSFAVPRHASLSQEEVYALVADTVSRWVRTLVT